MSVSDEDICLSCGMCCDGTLFAKAPLLDEDPPSVAAGLEVTHEPDGRRFFRQPCPHLCEVRCSIYPIRPTTCRNFHCKLLLQKEAGEVSAGEARAVISKAQELIAEVVATDPEARLYEGRKRIRQQLAEASKDQQALPSKAIGRRLLNIIALDEYLAARFRKKRN